MSQGPGKLLIYSVKSKQKSHDNYVVGLSLKLGPISGSYTFNIPVPTHFRGVVLQPLRISNSNGDVLEYFEGSNGILAIECTESEFAGLYKTAKISFNGGTCNCHLRFSS